VAFIGGLQRSHWALDGVLKPLIVISTGILSAAPKLDPSLAGYLSLSLEGDLKVLRYQSLSFFKTIN
jgi:hypothetical protein